MTFYDIDKLAQSVLLSKICCVGSTWCLAESFYTVVELGGWSHGPSFFASASFDSVDISEMLSSGAATSPVWRSLIGTGPKTTCDRLANMASSASALRCRPSRTHWRHAVWMMRAQYSSRPRIIVDVASRQRVRSGPFLRSPSSPVTSRVVPRKFCVSASRMSMQWTTSPS